MINNIGLMLKSLAKIAIQSRRVTLSKVVDGGSIIILGNGPSLKDTITNSIDTLRSSDCMTVNFAANTSEFFDIKPKYHLMADPHFFVRLDQENVRNLYSNLKKVDWQLNLLVPRQHVSTINKLLGNKSNLNIITFNFVGLNGPQWFESFTYNHKLGMPRPRNVLIPAIMCAISLGYTELRLAGADHSWLQSIWVNNHNEVVSVQPHFYAEEKKELERVRNEYTSYKLHDILLSFHIAFKSYHTIHSFAQRNGVKIINTTPGSYIDAFERGSL